MRNYTDGMLVLVTEAYYIPENDEIETRITEATSMEIQATDWRGMKTKGGRDFISVIAYDPENMRLPLKGNIAHRTERELFSINTSWSAKYPETVMKFGPLHEDNPAEIIMNNKQHEAFFKGLAKKVTENVRSGKISVDKLTEFKYRDDGSSVPSIRSFQRAPTQTGTIDKTTDRYKRNYGTIDTVIDHLGKIADGQLAVLDLYRTIEMPIKDVHRALHGWGVSSKQARDDFSEAISTVLTHGLGDENILDTTMNVFKEAMAVSPTKVGGRNKQSPDDIIKAYTSEGNLGQTAVRLRALRSGSSHQPAFVRGLYNKMC